MANQPIPWAARPWRLLPNRVSRFYRGGLLIEQFRGLPDPSDGNRPEDWLGSATRSWTAPGEPTTEEGLSAAELGGEVRRVADVLAADPIGVAGPGLAGTGTTGVLVKLLDAGNRLPVHLHPTRSFAREHLGSPFGKAEAWIVLATRQAAGAAPPHVRLGFRRRVDRPELRRWIEDESTEDLLDALHESPTAAGDVWFVPPGTPHAIGAGVFILEIQEPTDFSIVLERRGFPVGREDANLRLGWDVALDTVDLSGTDRPGFEALRGRWSRDPGVRSILPAGAEAFFWSVIVSADERPVTPDLPACFVVGAAVAGRGVVRTGAGDLPVRAGDTFAIPAAAATGIQVEGTSEPLEVILSGGAS